MKKFLSILLAVLVLGACGTATMDAKKRTIRSKARTTVVKGDPEVQNILNGLDGLLKQARSGSIGFEPLVTQVDALCQRFEAIKYKASKQQVKRYNRIMNALSQGYIAA